MAENQEDEEEKKPSAVLLNDKQEEHAAQDDDDNPDYATETPSAIDASDLEDLNSEDMKTVLDSASGLFEDEQARQVRTVRRNRTIETEREEVQRRSNVDISGVEGDIDNLSDAVDSLVNEELEGVTNNVLLRAVTERLELIGQLLVRQSELLKVQSSAQVTTISSLTQIKRDLQPYSQITVSGVNTISSPDTAELVVPQSDSGKIETKTIFLRASRNNNQPIAFGDDGVKPNTGFVLNSGEVKVLDMDVSLVELYMASEEAGQSVEIMGVK